MKQMTTIYTGLSFHDLGPIKFFIPPLKKYYIFLLFFKKKKLNKNKTNKQAKLNAV